MKTLIVGNYKYDRAGSMRRYSDLLASGLLERGIVVTKIEPEPRLSTLRRSSDGMGKWLGYVDKFGVFRVKVFVFKHKWKKEFDLVHIVDQANAVYHEWFSGMATIVTCHDLIAVRAARGEFAGIRVKCTGRLYQSWILESLKRVKNVCAVSEKTRSDLARLTGRVEETIRVIPNALNYAYTPLDFAVASAMVMALLGQRGLDATIVKPGGGGYILHIGGNNWYKNRLGVIRIYAQLKAKSLDSCPSLLMAGQPFSAEMRFFCAEHGLEKHVICLGEVSNLELNALYAGTELLLFPSLEEGFGWPILEALAAGCRVVTTDRAPMSEIGGAAAYYLPPAPYGADEQKLTAWARTAAEILWAALTEPRDRHGWRVVEGLRLARHFDQAKMMDAYLEEYRIAIEG